MDESTGQRKSRASRGGGPRSRGCITCKSRKIKCDEAKPACVKCTKSGRHCDGYQDQDSFIFRHETARLKRQYGGPLPPSTGFEISDKSVMQSSRATTQVLEFARSHIHQSPRLSVEHETLDFFLGKYKIDISKFGAQPMGFLGLLPRLYGMAREGTCLQKALVATALTVAAKERLDPRLAVLSRVHYQATLKSTNECLGDPIRAVSDEVLGTIELLRFRESFTFVFAEPESSTIAKHIRGGCALLKIRGPAVAQTEEGACLFMAFSVHGLAESLMSRKDLYPFLKGYAKSISISRPIMLSHSAMLLVPAILQRFDKVTVGSTDTSEAQEELLAIILNSANVDSKMLSGLCEVPHGWTPETIALPPGFELPRPAPDSRFLPGLFRPYFRYYKHATACTGYLFLLIGRLYLQRLQLDCYALLHASTKNSMAFNPMADCVDTINSCVGEFTESMAFLEGYHISQQNTASDGTGRTQLRLENHSTGEPDMASIGGWCVPWMVGEVSNQAKDDLEDSLARRVKEWVQYCQDLLKRRRAFWDVVDGV